MSFLFRPQRAAVEQRSVSFQDVFGTGGDVTTVGGRYSGLVPLFAAHREIVDAVASTPFHVYRERPDGTSQRLARDPDLMRPLAGTRYTWKAQIVASLLADGNAFGLPSGYSGGWPTGIVWTSPYDWQVDENGLLPVYRYLGEVVPRESVIHIPWIVPPGCWRGLSPLKAFRVAFEAGEATQRSMRDWFKGGAIPSGHLKNTARALKPAQAEEAKSIYRVAVEGRDVLVTGNEWDYKTIGIPADEQRFVESLKLTAGQVAAIYGLDPEDVGGEAANSLTYATVEGNERKRARRAAPWCMRIEEALTDALPRPQYVKANLDANVRADLLSRMQAHAVALDNGLETLDDARALEDKAPLSEAEWAQWQRWHAVKSAAAAKDAAPAAREQETA